MICPRCRSGNCRRSHRRGLRDRGGTLFGLRPWRCEICETRFYAWKVPAAFVHYAHCSRCGNLDLQRIAKERVERAPLKWLWPRLGAHAYRCAQCRRRFFSFRRYRRITTLVEPRPDLAKDSAGTPA